MALWKALAADMKSSHGWGGDFGPWVKNEWYEVEGPLNADGNGFHCSDDVCLCMEPVLVQYLCQVETAGDSIIREWDQCWQKMRVTSIKAWPPSKGALVLDWAENRAHDYWAGIFPTEAALYETRHYQGNFAQMLAIIQPVYKSLFINGETIQLFPTHAYKRKPEYLWQLEQAVYLAYLLALVKTETVGPVYGGGTFARWAEHARPRSLATIRGFVEDHWTTLPEV